MDTGPRVRAGPRPGQGLGAGEQVHLLRCCGQLLRDVAGMQQAFPLLQTPKWTNKYTNTWAARGDGGKDINGRVATLRADSPRARPR